MLGQIEREIKLLNVDVNNIKAILEKNNIKPKGKYIQDVYTFDLPSVDELYIKYINNLLVDNDKRALMKLFSEIRPCFDKNDLNLIEKVLGTNDLSEFINDSNNDYNKLFSEELFKLMKKINENFSKWVRLRQTGNETTITIKRIVNSKGEYELDAVNELEFDVPSIEVGKELLEDLGYFFARHQIKMRIVYSYKNAEIVIDKWPKLAPYVEIEAATKEEIDEIVVMLGYNLDDAVIINTDDIYNEKGIDIYSKEYRDLSFNEEELKEVKVYMEG